MSTILRSRNYIRCFNIFARKIVVSNNSKTFLKKCLELETRCTNHCLTKSYATIPALEQKEIVPNFDEIFTKLDERVRRGGRISVSEIEEIFNTVRKYGNISSLDALFLIRCCGNALVEATVDERNKYVDEIWDMLDILKIPIDVSHFNALLKVYLENNREFSPVDVLAAMKAKNVTPNRVTYQRLMLYHCQKGDIESATNILTFMKEKEIPLNETVFAALITGHSEAGDLESAKKTLDIMKKAKVEVTSKTYKALLNAYAKRGDINSIKETISEAKERNLYFQDNDYFEIIHKLVISDKAEHVEEILEMIPKGPFYNADGVHAILKLLDVGNIDVAIKILSTMKKRRNENVDAAENGGGIFMIKKLIIAKHPIDTIISTCKKLRETGNNDNALLYALYASLVNNHVEPSLRLLEEYKKEGGPIREHYFWPLLVFHGKTSNFQGLRNVLEKMIKEFNVLPSVETLKDFVLPYMFGEWQEVIESLEELSIPRETIINSMACRMLTDYKLRRTATFMLSNPCRFDHRSFVQPLYEALRTTNDCQSFALILRLLCESQVEVNAKLESTDPAHKSPTDIVDNVMEFILAANMNSKISTIEKLLMQFEQFGLSISPKVADEVRAILGDPVDPILQERIAKLASGDLTLKPLSEIDLKEAINLQPFEKGSKFESKSLSEKKYQLFQAFDSNDVETAENIIQELENLRFKFLPGSCAEIIEAYCKLDNLEMAEKWINKFQAAYPNMKLDVHKTIMYATCLIKRNRFDDAIDFIRAWPREEIDENKGVHWRVLMKKLLDAAVETDNVEKTDELFNVLVQSNYLEPDTSTLAPLIKIHLKQNNLAAALEKFQEVSERYGCTPLKNELSKAFVSVEDAISLQKLTDVSVKIHGTNNSLIDLVFAFIECGRLRQARKILETPGLRLRGRKLEVAVSRYVDGNMHDYLDQLFELTKNLMVIDRQEFYNALMDAYVVKNNYERGLSLWTKIQEEGDQPSNRCLTVLANLLKKNHQPIPFTYDNAEIVTNEHESSLDYKKFQRFAMALRENDLIEAENILQTISSKHPEFTTATAKLVSANVEKQNYSVAEKLLKNLIDNEGRIPRSSSLKHLWNVYAESGELEKLLNHGNGLSDQIKRSLRFEKFVSRAQLKKVGLTKFLSEFESKITNDRTNNMKIVRQSLHFRTLISEFEKNPQAMEDFYPIAERLANQNIYSAIQLSWTYYFIKKHPMAEEIWSKHLVNVPQILYKYILQTSAETNDIDMAENLWQKLTTHPHLTANAKVYVFSNLINLYNKSGRLEDVAKLIEGSSRKFIQLWQETCPIVANDCMKNIVLSENSTSLETNNTRQAI